VKNEVNTARQYISMLQQVINSARSVKSMEGLSSLAQVQKELALYNQLANIGSQMSGTLDRSLKLSQNLQAQYGASNMDWKTFITSRDEIRKSRAQALASQYAATDASMKEVAQRRAAIVEQIQAATGETAAMQSVGAGIDALIGQNQQMLGLLKAQGQDTLVKDSVKEADATQSMQELINFQKERAAAANKFK
jgi:type IV secretion system protein TrbJ